MEADKTLKLHADVDPIYFSPNFKPMVKLVEILSAEARRAKHTTEDDSDDDTLRTGVRVHALEGAVATLGDLGPAATVRDLRRAVARAVGVAAADQRLYASAAGRLELVKDDDATLLDAGVWLPDEPRGAVHLRSAAYERLQRQLATATGAVEQLLEQRYGPFHASVSSVRTTAAQYQTLRKLAADAKTSVDACRAQLGLRRPVEIDGLADRAEAEPAGARVLEHWEAQVEAEEALRLLAELRPHAR